MRAILPELAETPEISWNRLAAEMKANIRLGLAAGECVRTGQTPLRETPLFTRARAVVAFASVVVLLVTGLVLEHPAPSAPKYDGVVVQTTANGIQVRGGRTGAPPAALRRPKRAVLGGRARLHEGSLRGPRNGLRDDQ